MAQVLSQRGVVLRLVIAFLVLALSAQQARKYLSKESASKTGSFSWRDCFDLKFGSLACVTKEGGKLYTHNIRAGIVERAKHKAYHVAYQSALSKGMAMSEAGKQAQKMARLAAKATSTKARRISGPLFAAAWDSFEVLYYGGTVVEVSMRAIGTLCGTWWGGLQGEKKMGRVGYLVGSQIGSWGGSRLAFMLYDIARAVQVLTLEAWDVVFGIGAIRNNSREDEIGADSEERYNSDL